ncbi:hypothetical protein BKA82DRAFT_4135945 [Pisolithus tinctorius]|nr:hypothetical protein BKA82DRAFT_4135945 [Pisolithus tinctorius]
MPHMRVYLASNAGKVLQLLRDTNPELSAQLQVQSLDLSSYLLVPMSDSISSSHLTNSAIH